MKQTLYCQIIVSISDSLLTIVVDIHIHKIRAFFLLTAEVLKKHIFVTILKICCLHIFKILTQDCVRKEMLSDY